MRKVWTTGSATEGPGGGVPAGRASGAAATYAARAACTVINPAGSSVVLLLHGLGANGGQPLALVGEPGTAWSRPLAEQVARQNDVCLVAPDLRAHGGTPVIGDLACFTFDALAADVEALIGRLDLAGRPMLGVGISMGAAVALRLALRANLPLRRLSLLRPAFTDQPCPANLGAFPVIAELLRDFDRAAGKAKLVMTHEYQRVAGISPAAAASLLAQFDDPGARARRARLDAVPRNRAFTNPSDLRALVPTVDVLAAERDPVHPVVIAEQWAGAIPAARLHWARPRDDDPAGYTADCTRMVMAAVRALS